MTKTIAKPKTPAEPEAPAEPLRHTMIPKDAGGAEEPAPGEETNAGDAGTQEKPR